MGRFVSCFRPGPATDYYGSFKVERSQIEPPPCDADNEETAKQLMDGAAKLGIKPSLASTFSGATVFLTGGTGYVGSVLIEQLLRGVPDLEAIYVLVRPKHGAEPEARLDRLLARPIFDALRVAADEEEEGEKEDEVEEEEEEGAAAPSAASSSSSAASDVDSANNAGGERPAAPAAAAAASAAAAAAAAAAPATPFDGVLQFKAPRRPLLPHLRAKLRVLSGDVCKARCGLSAADAEVVATKCDYIVHCAASISFFEHVHVLLEQNYVATRNVLDLAAEAMTRVRKEAEGGAAASAAAAAAGSSSSSPLPPRLRGMVHVSTAYVNSNLKRGTHVEERIYPLVRETTDRRTGETTRTVLSHADVAAELLALPAAAATKAADKLVAEFGFPNAYTLSKHLAEDSVADAVEGKLALLAERESDDEKEEEKTTRRLRAAIVRPTIIGACAGGPAPGYFGNAAGPTQLMLAYASEMATFLCHNPNHVWDIAPCDIVGSVILGAAAALDVARRVEEATATETPGGASLSSSRRLLTFHAASSMSNTIRYGDLFTKWVIPFWDDHMPPRRFRASKKYKSIHSWSSFVPEKSLAYSWMRLVGDVKFGSLAALLRVAGQRQPAEALWRGWRYLCLYNDERLDFGLFFCVRNVEAVENVMLESLAPWTPGAKAYEKGTRGAVVVGDAAAACSCLRHPRVLVPAGSMTATGDAVVSAAIDAAAAANAAATTPTPTPPPPPTTMPTTPTTTTPTTTSTAAAPSSATAATTATFLPAPLTWRGDWGPYMLRYSEVIHAKFFGPDGALTGAGGMKKGKKAKGGAAAAEKKTKASNNAAAASVSASSTTTPRRARAMAGVALAGRAPRRSPGAVGEEEQAAGDVAAIHEASRLASAAANKPALAIQSAPATPARQVAPSPSSPAPAASASSSASSPPSTPPNEPVSPRSVFVVSSSSSGSGAKAGGDKSSDSVTPAVHSSASSSPATFLRRLTPQRLAKFSLGGGATAAAAEKAAAARPSSTPSSLSSSLAEPPAQVVHSDSFKDLSEYSSSAAAAAAAAAPEV